MNNIFKILLITIIGTLLVSGCKKDPVEEEEVYSPTPTTIPYPYNFPDMVIPADNQPTEEAIALGRSLYYDNILHKNQSMSCSSCHDQAKSFTTYASNSLVHVNLGWNQHFLWNGKVEGTLEDIMMFEVEDFLQTDMDVVNQSEKYRSKFKQAYGINTITSKDVANALAQFFRTMNSYDSKYDKWLRGEAIFTPEEYEGLEIFNSESGDCFHCHSTVLFHDNAFSNNGLDLNPTSGLFATTGNPNDFGKFKTPTLRNIELTAPYMHDGRYETLEEVVEFYSTGVEHNSPNISPLMKFSAQGGVQLNPMEVQSLIAFLKTLTDQSYTTRESLSDPN